MLKHQVSVYCTSRMQPGLKGSQRVYIQIPPWYFRPFISHTWDIRKSHSQHSLLGWRWTVSHARDLLPKPSSLFSHDIRELHPRLLAFSFFISLPSLYDCDGYLSRTVTQFAPTHCVRLQPCCRRWPMADLPNLTPGLSIWGFAAALLNLDYPPSVSVCQIPPVRASSRSMITYSLASFFIRLGALIICPYAMDYRIQTLMTVDPVCLSHYLFSMFSGIVSF